MPQRSTRHAENKDERARAQYSSRTQLITLHSEERAHKGGPHRTTMSRAGQLLGGTPRGRAQQSPERANPEGRARLMTHRKISWERRAGELNTAVHRTSGKDGTHMHEIPCMSISCALDDTLFGRSCVQPRS